MSRSQAPGAKLRSGRASLGTTARRYEEVRAREMKIKDYRETAIEPLEDAPGVTIRRVITHGDGAPHFTMRIIDVPPGKSTPYHSHPWEHEIFVLAGQGVAKQRKNETQIAEGTVVLVFPEEEHQFTNTGEAMLQLLCLNPHIT